MKETLGKQVRNTTDFLSLECQPPGLPRFHVSNNLQLLTAFSHRFLNKIRSHSFPFSISMAPSTTFLLAVCPSVTLILISQMDEALTDPGIIFIKMLINVYLVRNTSLIHYHTQGTGMGKGRKLRIICCHSLLEMYMPLASEGCGKVTLVYGKTQYSMYWNRDTIQFRIKTLNFI